MRKAKPTIDQVAAMANQAVDNAAASTTLAIDWIGEQGKNLNTTQKKLVSDTSAYLAGHRLCLPPEAILAGIGFDPGKRTEIPLIRGKVLDIRFNYGNLRAKKFRL